jgi:hypothetical protein
MYETLHTPAEPVLQSRSGLLPGLSTSLGLPGRNQNLTWVDEPAPANGFPS